VCRVEREIYVSEIDGALTPAVARQLGAALIAAADEAEAEQMNGYDQISSLRSWVSGVRALDAQGGGGS
jgi:hypothetical protein